VKRVRTKRKKKAKVPDQLIPIVDAVVEMVFARLTEAAAKAKRQAGKKSSAKPEEQRGLAGAVADLMLASLARDPSNTRQTKAAGEERPKRRRRNLRGPKHPAHQ
jgi:hypothetical protein